ncbi:hypothetical protein ATANTOWER_006454 [Ataeniobius toweri]|uniref:Uncharacterized protein n=1 Tax=Ataeniobius toweri TaxID=208326 RepID=A0ABU7CI76_9TELE|nr:hypothetical protein [Ataeniobius toweri]
MQILQFYPAQTQKTHEGFFLTFGFFHLFRLLCGTPLYHHENHRVLNSLTTSTDSGYLQSHQISINSLQRSASFFFFLLHFLSSLSNQDTETLSSLQLLLHSHKAFIIDHK